MAEHTWNISPLHCGISVSNLEASIEWFGRVLDFEVVSRDSIPAAGFDLAFCVASVMGGAMFEMGILKSNCFNAMSTKRCRRSEKCRIWI